MQEDSDFDNICSICYENLDDQSSYTLECNHKYHTKCIMKWFRNLNSKCPLCNDEKLDTSNMSYQVKLETISEIKKFGKRKKCPKNIKDQIKNISKLKSEYRNWKQEFSEFKKDNNELLKKYDKMVIKRYNFERKIRQADHKLLSIVKLNPIYIK